jgi:FKBP-type peptidyl-prolyl cis-trans isomerase
MIGSRMILLQLLVMFLLAFGSCREPQQQQDVSTDSLKEHLINANKIMVENESKEIDDFISRHSWKMISSGTGLRYCIDQPGKGKMAEEKKTVSISYSVYLTDGTLCYSADDKNPLMLTLGRGEQTRGLEEGILFLHEGGKARLVVPAHLGYGRLGDDKKIPGGSTLYYEVTLLKVNDTP